MIDLRSLLSRVGQDYRREDGFETDSQALLRDVPSILAPYAPLGYIVRGSGGQYPLNTTETPWVGFFDPDETRSATQGLYVVYLLRADRSAWELTLLMGTEQRAKDAALQRGLGSPRGTEASVRDALRAETSRIRSELTSDLANAWGETIDLRSSGTRQLRYEASTILARAYPLPLQAADEELAADLSEMLELYERAVAAKRRLAVLDPREVSTKSSTVPDNDDSIEYEFEPGEDRAVVVKTRGGYRRSPRHESGLRLYGDWLRSQDYDLSTRVHPRDLVVRTPSGAWLVEYKVVYAGGETRATREALSQLKEYAYFLYPASQQPTLLAAFSQPIPPQRLSWLLSEGVQAVWFEDGMWLGSEGSVSAGMAEAHDVTGSRATRS